MYFLQFGKTLSVYMALLLFTSMTPTAFADGEWDLGLAIGYGKRSNPLINSDDIMLLNRLSPWFYWQAFARYYADSNQPPRT
ncbi:MAG: hypothetical protein ACI92E_003221 [Oceanicoccus sp.]|jgi:hypothetical protein